VVKKKNNREVEENVCQVLIKSENVHFKDLVAPIMLGLIITRITDDVLGCCLLFLKWLE
jgi:hypothetical protein